MLQIQRLNMDNSWHINLGGVSFLVDPWLLGSEIDFFPWFNEQWHKTKPIAIEKIANYDFILITQKYPDHFHIETLKKLSPKKLVVPQSIEKKCKKLFPDTEVLVFNDNITSVFGFEMNIHFLPTPRKMDPIYDALVIENDKKSILLASHGFSLNKKQIEFIQQLPKIELLITPFNKFKLPNILGGFVSPGIESVRKLIKQINPTKVVTTHDEDKHAKGLIIKLAKINWAPKPEVLSQKEYFGEKYLHIPNYQTHNL